ncbi:MAG TPA: HIT family protein [Bacteroidales bacterium]|nr:HIT family protein [Bacteroidales bacterium]
MSSIFTKIIRGEIPCYKVAEDEKFFAFLDINPLKKGHTLIIPKEEVDYIFDLDEDLLAEMMVFSRKIALAIEKVVPCNRIGVVVLGLEVPHAHIHLIPIDSEADVRFSNPREQMNEEEFKDLAERINKQII